MLLSRNQTLEDKVVQIVRGTPLQVKELHARLGGEMSLRAVYKAVDALINARVLLKVGKKLWIDQEWVRLLRQYFSPALPILSPGEKISYTFASIEHLDAFWKTVALQLEEYEHDWQIFFYNPHNFWAYMPGRKESEDAYYAHFLATKKHAYFTVGGTTAADREFKRTYQNDFLQIDVRTVPKLGRRDHITVLGDFVITVRLSSPLATGLDALYNSDKSISILTPVILKACTAPGGIRLVFEHNAAKAKKLKKMLSHNFAILTA